MWFLWVISLASDQLINLSSLLSFCGLFPSPLPGSSLQLQRMLPNLSITGGAGRGVWLGAQYKEKLQVPSVPGRGLKGGCRVGAQG